MKLWYLVLGVVLVVGLIYWIQHDGKIAIPRFDAEQPDEPDLLIENAKLIAFGDDGEIEYKITSAHIEQFEDEGIVDLTAVKMWSFIDDVRHIELTAGSGKITGLGTLGEERVEFRAGLLLHEHVSDAVVATFETESMSLLPRQNYVQSDHPVTMTQGTSKIHAEGFEVDFENRWIHFVSSDEKQVRIEIQTNTHR